MRISVVGGGVFGCTAALFLARAGHKVTLFEEKDRLLSGATGHNQFRLHSGYHYPRSTLTIEECQRSLASFMAEYGACVVMGPQMHLYGIAKHHSKVTAEQYEATMRESGLQLHRTDTRIVDPEYVPDVFMVGEHWIDIDVMRRQIIDDLRAAGVDIKVNTRAEGKIRHECDRLVVAAYHESNDFTGTVPAYERCKPMQMQFEIVEKPVVWIDSEDTRRTGIVVMDGPFPCLDPYGPREAHLFGHAKFSIIRTHVGERLEIPYYLQKDINAGIIANRALRQSRFEEMRDDAAFYIPSIRNAYHLGSFITVRAVRPDVDATDERLTDVRYIDKDQGVIRIFSGKIGSCVSAAKQVLELL
jgi:Trk K+ transport system NAD-binding subunit